MAKKDILQLLQGLGYQQLPASWVMQLRGGNISNPLLENVLLQQLAQINHFRYNTTAYKFSAAAIDDAFLTLKYAKPVDYNNTYYLLRNGKLSTETVGADRKTFPLQYIDWNNVSNNTFQMVEELEITLGRYRRRIDLALFVNGIPLVLFEFKRLDSTQSDLKEWVPDHNHHATSTPFTFAQLLISASPKEVRYSTISAKNDQWYTWKGTNDESTVESILHDICAPDRLISFIRYAILTNQHDKLIPRAHQIHAVQHTMDWIKERWSIGGQREGVVAQTTGSGIIMTMALLVNRLLNGTAPIRPFILIITNSHEEEENIHSRFSSFSLPVMRATSRAHLLRLLKEEGGAIISVVLSKFYAISALDFNNIDSRNVLILIDERLKGNYETALLRMRQLFPVAICIGFTGTPLSVKSQEVIYQYSYAESVKDQLSVDCLYQLRTQEIHLSEPGYEAVIYNKPWKRSQISKSTLATDHAISQIGKDIIAHYSATNKNTPFKGMLIAPSKCIAVKYQRYFDAQKGTGSHLNTAVVMSNMAETMLYNGECKYEGYYENLMFVYGSEEAYTREVLRKIQSPSDEIELVITTDHLMTGLDTPLLKTLYIARYMQGHNLFQAMARVSRPGLNKTNAEIVDYVGIWKGLENGLKEIVSASTVNSGKKGLISLRDAVQQLEGKLIALDSIAKKLIKQQNRKKADDAAIEELLHLFETQLLECTSIMNLKDFSKDVFDKYPSERLQHFRERITAHEHFFNELKQKFIADSSTLLAEHVQEQETSYIISDNQLAKAYVGLLQTLLKEKGKKLPDKALTGYSQELAGKITALLIRDWQLSSRVLEKINDGVEDMLLSFSKQYQLNLELKEIDVLLNDFMEITKKIKQQ